MVQLDNSAKKFAISDGIDFDLQTRKEVENHWMVAVENSRVVWIKEIDNNRKNAGVLLESESQPGIFYYYGNLFKRNLEVREGQKVLRGELIGSVPDGKEWGRVHFTIVKNDSVPGIKDVGTNVINFFPQLFELYFRKSFVFSKSYSKGSITFGSANENEKNNLAFKEYTGKGWKLGCWNISDKVPFVSKGDRQDARLSKILFAGSIAESENPVDYYDYEISVKNGTYRVRAKIGDVEMETWQKVEFENFSAGEFSLKRGIQEWTDESIVKVNDGKLTVRIYIDQHNKPAGLSEIVFQQAF